MDTYNLESKYIYADIINMLANVITSMSQPNHHDCAEQPTILDITDDEQS